MMKKTKKCLFLCLSSAILLCSCGEDYRDFSSYEPITEYCYSELDKNNSGMNKVCNLNKVKTSNNTYVSPFDSDLIYTLFPYNKLTLENVYEIEKTMGETSIKLHKEFDRHNYYSENDEIINNLKVINESYGTGKIIKVSDDLFNILSLSLDLGELSNGKFNIAIGELSDYWNKLIKFNNSNYDFYDPDLVIVNNATLNEEEKNALENSIQNELKTKLNTLIENTPSSKELNEILILDKENKTVEFKKYKNVEKVSLTLGGIGKGYAMGIVANDLLEKGYNYGYISGATSSNVILGNHYKNNEWSIGISSPSKNDYYVGGYLKLNGYYQISTSGDEVNSYRFIDRNYNLITRHHIIDSTTGYPLNTFRKVTVVSKTLNASIMDALSTILINTNEDNIEIVINAFKNAYNADIDAIFQKSNDNETEYYYYVTSGLKNNFIINDKNPVTSKVFYYEF